MTIYPNLILEPLKVNETLDFKEEIKTRNDIIDIKETFVTGTIMFEDDVLFANLVVDVNLVLASTRTLKPINYHLKFPLDLIFGEHEDADFILENEIPLKEIIFGHIILEKPLSIYEEDEELVVKKEKTIHPAFESLKDYKPKEVD